jgi:membrane protein implicated in regulation of membrane protease activity
MLLVAIAWLYVVAMVAVAEATSATGTLLGAAFTLVLYGLLPLSILGYLFFSPARRRARRSAERAAAIDLPVDPDEGRHAAGAAVAPERKEP